jgi:processive 1,2-diacylglycerol beta-glucosyltransferase
VRRVAIVSASVGAGHDGAAAELARRLRGIGYQVDVHDFLDLLPGGLGRSLSATYLRQLQVAPRSWEILLKLLELCRPLAVFVTWLCGLAGKKMVRAIGPEVDLVVSTYPLASQSLLRLKRRGRLAAPVVTYLCDLSVHRLWVAKDADLHMALHPVSAAQARRLGARRIAITGPAIAPKFRPVAGNQERQLSRKQLGLPSEGRLALVFGGSWGVGDIEQTAVDIAETGVATPVVLCGTNTALRDRLTEIGVGYALGWVEDMAVAMRACDVVVQNAGGLSSLEALATGLPVITYRCLVGHGRTNATALEDAGIVPWVREKSELRGTLRALLDGDISRYRKAAEAVTTAVDPSLVLAAMVPEQTPIPMGRGHRSRRRLALTAAGLVGLAWLGTVGVSLAVAGGLQSIGPASRHRGEVFFMVAVDPNRPIDESTIDRLASLHAGAAVSTEVVRRQPQTVRALARAGVVIVNAANGAPYATGVFSGRTAIGQAAAEIASATGRPPRLMVSNGDLDALDVSIVAVHRERIVIPSTMVRCGVTPGRTMRGVVLVEQSSECDLTTTLDELSRQADDVAVRPAWIEELTS